MKAIVEVAPAGSVFRAVQQQLAESGSGKTPDFRLSFESAKNLFANLTPVRLELLDTLRRIGPWASIIIPPKTDCDTWSEA